MYVVCSQQRPCELRAVVDRAFERKVLAFGALHGDIQVHLIDGVGAQVFQALGARFLGFVPSASIVAASVEGGVGVDWSGDGPAGRIG